MINDIVKSNALIEASYSPGSIHRMRVLMVCLLQIKSKESLDVSRDFVITASALAGLTGAKAVHNYKELKKAADDLLGMHITVHDLPNGEHGKPSRKKINIVSACEYYDQEGKIVLNFTSHIAPYISDLKKKFTCYQRKHVVSMKSSYGVRLYELCLQCLDNKREFSVDEFRGLFGLEKKYSSMKDLKKYVVFKAIEDINKYSNITVEFGQRKSGRAVSHFQFMIVKKKGDKHLQQDLLRD